MIFNVQEKRKIDIIDSLTEFLITNSDMTDLVEIYNAWKYTFWKGGELPCDSEVHFAITSIKQLLR